MGKFRDAAALYSLRRGVAESRKTWGLLDRRTLTAMAILAEKHHELGQIDAAIEWYEQVVAGRLQACDPSRDGLSYADLSNPAPSVSLLQVNRARESLARLYVQVERVREAIPLLEAALQFFTDFDSPDINMPASAEDVRRHLIDAYMRVGRVGDELTLYDDSIEYTERTYGPNHELSKLGLVAK